MLDGVRSDLLSSLSENKVKAKVYVTYGSEWYLYVVHRLAEYPPNIYTFISDIVELRTNREIRNEITCSNDNQVGVFFKGRFLFILE